MLGGVARITCTEVLDFRWVSTSVLNGVVNRWVPMSAVGFHPYHAELLARY
tara:strand:- start:7485 stop:7637 length:153 start_codon:yes stop_codon:yes gene_type:complete